MTFFNPYLSSCCLPSFATGFSFMNFSMGVSFGLPSFQFSFGFGAGNPFLFTPMTSCYPAYLQMPMPLLPPITVPEINFTFDDIKISSDNTWDNYWNIEHSWNPNIGSHSRRRKTGRIDNSYCTLSRAQALEKARSDTNLEELKGGLHWSVASEAFKTDIPYAKKGTSEILERVSEQIGEDLVITSALGTGEAGSPHQKDGYESHHNAFNPKLDIRTAGKDAQSLAQKLRDTGYFSRVSIEDDHLDVQIDINKYGSSLSLTA